MTETFDETDETLTELGRAVMSWNSFENATRLLLTRLVSFREEHLLRAADRHNEVKDVIYRARILTTHLKSVGLTDAIRVFAKAGKHDLAEHLEHLINLFDQLRVLRNFYVHGTQSVGSTAVATQFNAKGSLTFSSMQFEKKDLEAFVQHMRAAERYTHNLHHALLNPDQPADQHPADVLPLALLQKPFLPEKLKRSRRFIIGEEPPPQTSRKK